MLFVSNHRQLKGFSRQGKHLSISKQYPHRSSLLSKVIFAMISPVTSKSSFRGSEVKTITSSLASIGL